MSRTADHLAPSRPHAEPSERAYQQGYDACVLGARLEENPYAGANGADAGLWQRGWLAAFKLVNGSVSAG